MWFVGIACQKPIAENYDANDEILSGGTQTVFDESSRAFTHGFNNLSPTHARVHEIGDMLFEQTFVTNPAPARGGLGPLYINVSCISCHVNDGRGKVPGLQEDNVSLLYRLSLAGVNAHGGPNPVPGFGDQLQHRAVEGKMPEATVQIQYQEQAILLNGGEIVNLRKPMYTLQQSYMPLPAGVMISPRVAAPVFGLGLLEAISETDILQHADVLDVNGDGISGKPNYVWSVNKQQQVLGRFGWKCNQPDLIQQTASAFNGDMGITNSYFPIENSWGQMQYDGLNDDVEITDSMLHAVAFYVKTLSVPARRKSQDLQVLRGKQIFMDANCQACHVQQYYTATQVAFPALSHQKIYPYTDLLLHDMGEELADGRPDYLATGTEWRTPPLWGIGLTQKVNGHTQFLHDGRARNLLEAIMWHGGEATASKQYVGKLSIQERKDLLVFLQSL